MNAAGNKAALHQAPAYMYMFSYQTSAFGGFLKSPHYAEMPFVFNAHDAVGRTTNNDPQAIVLAQKMSKAWANFARTGNPGHGGLPDWPTYDVPTRQTMIFDKNCKVVADPDGEELRAMI